MTTLANHTDEQLMCSFQDGNESAFSELYNRYSKPLLNYFYKMVGHSENIAQDLLQELFYKIIKKPTAYNPKRPFKTWLYSVANNMCKNEYRKRGRQLKYHEQEDKDELECNMDSKAFKKRLKHELNKLSYEHRAVFILRFKEGLTVKEISSIEDVPEGTIKSRLFHATRQLTKKLADFNPKKE